MTFGKLQIIRGIVGGCSNEVLDRRAARPPRRRHGGPVGGELIAIEAQVAERLPHTDPLELRVAIATCVLTQGIPWDPPAPGHLSAIELHNATILDLILTRLDADPDRMLWAVDCAVAYGLGWTRQPSPGLPITLDSVWPRAFNWLVYLMWRAVESANRFLGPSVNGLDALAQESLCNPGTAIEVAATLANWFVYLSRQQCHTVTVQPARRFTKLMIDDETEEVIPGGRRAFRAQECVTVQPSNFLLPTGATVEIRVGPATARLILDEREPAIELRDGEEFEIEGALAHAAGDVLEEVATIHQTSEFAYREAAHSVDSPVGPITGQGGGFVAQSAIEVRFVRPAGSLNVIRSEDDAEATVKLVDGPAGRGRELRLAEPGTLRLEGPMSVAECCCGGFYCPRGHSLERGLSFAPRATFASIVATAVHGTLPIRVKSFGASMYYSFLANGFWRPGSQIRGGLTPLTPVTRQNPESEWREYQGALECLVFLYKGAPFHRSTKRQCTARIQYPLLAGAAEARACGCLNPPGAATCRFCGNNIEELDTTDVWTSQWPSIRLIGFEDYQGGGPDGREDGPGGDGEDEEGDGE